MELFLSLFGLVLTVASIIYAFITNREKNKLQSLVKIRLEDMIKSIEAVRGNTKLAHTHIDHIRKFMNGLRRSDELKTMLDRVAWAEADITAAHRMLKRLRQDVASLQNGLFAVQEIPRFQNAPETDVAKNSNLPTVAEKEETQNITNP
jgi:hypothetical protein